jgi:hypothetical protein
VTDATGKTLALHRVKPRRHEFAIDAFHDPPTPCEALVIVNAILYCGLTYIVGTVGIGIGSGVFAHGGILVSVILINGNECQACNFLVLDIVYHTPLKGLGSLDYE